MLTKKLIILGAGNTLLDVIEIAKLQGIENIEIYDDDKSKIHKKMNNYNVLGNLKIGIKKNLKKAKFVFCFGTAKNISSREKIYKTFNFSPNDLVTLIHPNASVSSFAKIGRGVVIKSNAVVLPNANVGNNVIISQLASISHNVKIGNHSIVAPSASCSGGSQIGKSCFLGTNSTINENIKIGDNSIIGLGTKVIKSINKNTIYYEKK